jgi:hypothetical protein
MSLMMIRLMHVTVAGAFTLVLAPPPSAQEDFDRSPQNCISLARLDRTEIIDERTILFYMRDRSIYRNYLPETCRGLAPQDSFMYTVTARELCDTDAIEVLERWGSDLSRGRTCGLGVFYPITVEEVEELKAFPTPATIDVEPAEAEPEAPNEPPAPGEDSATED